MPLTLTPRTTLILAASALVLGGATLLIVSDLRARVDLQRQQLEAWSATSAVERDAAEARVGTAVADAVRRASGEHAQQLVELQGRLQTEREQLDLVTDERDAAASELQSVRAEAEALRERLRQLEMDAALHQTQLTALGDERLEQAGKASRLLEQVLERDRQLELVNRSLVDLRLQREQQARPASVLTVTRGEGPAVRATEALRRSGAGHVVLLEAELGQDGSLKGVLARLSEEDGSMRVISAERAALRFEGGYVRLRLETVRSALAPGATAADADATPPDPGPALPLLDIELPAFDSEAWVAAQVHVPQDYRAANKVSVALSELLERFDWEIGALTGVDGATLLGVELHQRDEEGETVRTLRAPRAELTAGPELRLWDGTVRTGGDERAFFGGIFRLPLPGLDPAAWDAALLAGGR